ncbi:MAG: transposase, partial [Actinomycetota bacterium]
DVYRTKPELAQAILKELKEFGFAIKLVLADSLYGESGDIITLLERLNIDFIVAIRSNHGVLMLPGQKVRYHRWKAYQQHLSHRQSETRFVREIIFGKRHRLRYYQITKGDTPDESGNNSWYIMTNLPGKIEREVAQLYSLRNWIEYGFKQVKNELGWSDYRLTDYHSIERWWELVYSVYLLVSLQSHNFQISGA